MCCDGWEIYPQDGDRVCDECGMPVDDAGETAVEHCNWANWECDKCGYAPCDDNC